MRALNMICGIAIIIAALHLVHGIQHFYGHIEREGMHSLGPLAALGGAVLLIGLCFVGAVQLFRRPN